MELDDKVYNQIVQLCEAGDMLFEVEQFDQALEKYLVALEMVPAPKTDWEASTWLYTVIGDTYLIKDDYEMAKSNFYNALNCPDGILNPLILLRLEKAKEYLLKAYMLEGYKIFFEEDDKYFDLIKDII
ncbi:hypothetical protein CON07_04905 [Bacillus sp. AFS094611]|uniref:hypothetical protein n=1 Tax=Bacillus sp. AFS094611 TaxID=2033516 RepID=UPI000BEBDA5D|nr:hypothetical protein [Bacillus sp. AFS094611]PDZ52509.1 hypothetical protein CON07_04905 [Bacillus sp. AFS094611]